MNEAKKMKHLWMVEDKPDGIEKKSFWTKIGVAFENRDGSWSLQLAAIPVNGRLQMRDPQTEEEKQALRERALQRDRERLGAAA